MSKHINNAQPPIPPYFTVPGKGTFPSNVPFYYASISSIWAWYRVDPCILEQYLEGTGLKVANFDGAGLVNFDFMFYAGHGGSQNNFENFSGITATTEVELNIVAYSVNDIGQLPELTAKEFILGEDQTKRYGVYRLHVPCDSIFAVSAGSQLFGEWGKFLAKFTYNVPTPNNPKQKDWDYAVYNEDCESADDNKGRIFTVKANLGGCLPIVGNGSAITDFGIMKKDKDDPDGRLVASRRNYFAIQETYLPENGRIDFDLSYGESDNQMRIDMEKMIGDTELFAVQTVISPPVIAEARPYYV